MIPKLGEHLNEAETTKVVVREQPCQICVLEPTGQSSTVCSSRETIVKDVSSVLVELARNNRALSFDGPDWIRTELREVGFTNV